MPLYGLKDVVDTELDGGFRTYSFRKSPTQVSVTNVWMDMSMSPGNPRPKYWFDASPLTAQVVRQSTDGGFFHGSNVSPKEKYLRSFNIYSYGSNATTILQSLILMDYLLYYPSIDESSTDEQITDNTNSLTRYTDGKGVQMIAVTVAARTGGQTFSVKYTNSDGVPNRITPNVRLNSYSGIGTIATFDTAQANASLFIPLQSGDKGVRSIQSITMNGSDVGLFSIILVKPLMTLDGYLSQQPATLVYSMTSEKDLLLETGDTPRIYDDAFLSFIFSPSLSTVNQTLFMGDIKVIFK